MSTDKRTVSTDALETLGTIIEGGGRDAIHLAVEPVKAGMTLHPGQHISAKDGVAMANGKALGIVDPFLSGPVFEGQMFWLVVFPRKITSLRHVWSHPDFPDNECPASRHVDGSASESWIKNYAAELYIDYRKLMDGAAAFLESKERGEWGDYLNDGPTLEGVSTADEFWVHYEIVTGRHVPPDHRENFFSCSC